jgi:hypothetical protein
MIQTLREMFRDQPHLASITLLVCVFSLSGLAYVLIDYLMRLRRKHEEVEPAIQHTFKVQEPVVATTEYKTSRIPAAGKPKYVRLPRKNASPPVQQKTGPERVYYYITREPEPSRKEQDEVEHRNLLKDAINHVVAIEAIPKKKPVRSAEELDEILREARLRRTAPGSASQQQENGSLVQAVSHAIETGSAPKKNVSKGKRIRRPEKMKQMTSAVERVPADVTEPEAPQIETLPGSVEVEPPTLIKEVSAETIQSAVAAATVLVNEDAVVASAAETDGETIHSVEAIEENIKAEETADSLIDALRQVATLGNVTLPEAAAEPEPVVEIKEAIENSEPQEVVLPASQNEYREGRRFIGYQPNKVFAQPDTWSYPFVSMPAPGSEVWAPRPLRLRLSRSAVEEMFQLEMRRTFPAFEIAGDDCIPDPAADKPHEPDISLVIKGLGLNLFIDVEIDEPYDRVTQTPKHLVGEDRERDDWFNNKGWIVIRLAESQVKGQPKHCLAFIARVIHSVYPEYHIPSHLKKLPDPKVVAQWTFHEVQKMIN